MVFEDLIAPLGSSARAVHRHTDTLARAGGVPKRQDRSSLRARREVKYGRGSDFYAGEGDSRVSKPQVT